MQPQETSAGSGEKTPGPDGFSPVEFEQSRRRKDGKREFPITGLGPDANYSLYVPSPKVERRMIWEAGKPVHVMMDSCLKEPRIAELRDQVIRSFAVEGPGLLSVDIAFMEYTAAILLINYELSDSDLTYLLSGSKWQSQMVAHVCGGPDLFDALQRLAPKLSGASPVHYEQMITQTQPRPRTWWQRLLLRIAGGE